MAKAFLGTGWTFPARVDSAGRIRLSKHEEDIEEAIRIILSTSKGERVMRPDFGCGIHDLVFESINAALLRQVQTSVYEALTMFEPRIELITVEVSDKEAHRGQLLISVDYRVRSTNTVFNLVYPFYLSEGIA